MRILIHSRAQFGYHIDTLKYAQMLRDTENVTYVCLDKNLSRVDVENVQVEYIESSYNLPFIRFIKLLHRTFKLSKKSDLVLLVYHPGVSLLRYLIKSKMILDIRSRVVSGGKWRRSFSNTLMRIESKFFENVSVVSEALGESLGLKRFHVVSVGCDLNGNVNTRESQRNIVSKCEFVYVGTFEDRRLDLLVQGFTSATKATDIDLKLHLIGTASAETLIDLRQMVESLGARDYIFFHGYQIDIAKYKLLYDSDCGIVHVPNDGRYDGQPSTKLFEYWASGIPVIASNYDVNCQLVSKQLGILYEFNSNSITNAILKFVEMRNVFNAEVILNEAKKNAWSNIVDNQLYPFLIEVYES